MGTDTMAKKKREQEEEVKPDHAPAVIAAVFSQLGRPRDLLKATAVNVYHTRYRVNVFRQTPEDNKTHITDTYFLIWEPEKGILEARPPIEPKYK